MKSEYEVMQPIWLLDEQRYALPGETVILDTLVAEPLVRMGVIKPIYNPEPDGEITPILESKEVKHGKNRS